MEPHADCARNAQDRVEARIPVFTERLVEALATESRELRDAGYSLSVGDFPNARISTAGPLAPVQDSSSPQVSGVHSMLGSVKYRSP
jgi:hypothetical protein